MNKILLIALIIIAFALIGYNTTNVDFERPFEGQSFIAVICIITSLCAVVLLLIFNASRKIQKKVEGDS